MPVSRDALTARDVPELRREVEEAQQLAEAASQLVSHAFSIPASVLKRFQSALETWLSHEARGDLAYLTPLPEKLIELAQKRDLYTRQVENFDRQISYFEAHPDDPTSLSLKPALEVMGAQCKIMLESAERDLSDMQSLLEDFEAPGFQEGARS